MTDDTPKSIEAVGDLIAFDPGARHPACAHFRAGVLQAAERVRVDPEWKELEPVDRCVRIALAAVRWIVGRGARPRYLLVEYPQIYRASKSKGDPNDLLLLATLDGALASALTILTSGQESQALLIKSPTPHEWAGGLPKTETGPAWDSARGFRVKSKLTDEEIITVEPSHDAIDAVGIGLFGLGRFKPRHVYDGVVAD